MLPLPVAAAAYGVLLGLGFTTFVLTFAVPALAGVALAVGDAGRRPRARPRVRRRPGAAGRRARAARRPAAGLRATDLMAERPAILRGFRAADAAALAAVALALGAQSASAQTQPFVAPAPPTRASAGPDLAWKVTGRAAASRARRAATGRSTPQQPAIGGPYLAVLLERRDPRLRPGDGRRGVARSPRPTPTRSPSRRTRVVWRDRRGDRLLARRCRPASRASSPPRRPTRSAARRSTSSASSSTSPGRTVSRIVQVDLATGARRDASPAAAQRAHQPVAAGRRAALRPAPRRGARRYGSAAARSCAIAPAIRADKGYSTKHGPHRRATHPRRPPKEGPPGTTTTLWTTALAPDAAYVTRLRQRSGATTADVLRLSR